jgi:regulatory protein
MSERHDAARAALEAALAATSDSTPGSVAPTPGAGPAAGREGGRRRRRSSPPDPEQDLQRRDDEPDPYDVARQIVLRQLAMAPRSRQQLRDKLRQRNCPDEVAEAVLDRMAEVGLVDDEAYAGMLVRSQQVGRGLATRALARELRTKGVDPETAEAALADIDPEDERERARALVDKKLRTMHGLDATVQTRRLAGMLARKGYDSSMAFGVIRDALSEAPEHRRD